MSEPEHAALERAPSIHERMLAGSIDAHVHAMPFLNERTLRLDVFDLAQRAAVAGMGAVVVKNYFGSSCEMAYLANRHAGGCRVVGGVTLNKSAGGFNPEAVKVAAHLGTIDGVRPGRVVWMPERSSLHRAKLLGLPLDSGRFLTPFRNGDVDAGLTPEAAEVLRVIAEEDMVLATSHLAPEEGLAIIELARAVGCRRFVITHASNTGVSYTLDQKRRAAALGAYIEEAAISWEPAMTVFHYAVADARADMFDAMREIGPEHFILASDCGFWLAPSPVEAMQVFVSLLLAVGFSEEEIRTMSTTNPRAVLGLDDPPSQVVANRDELNV